MPWAYHGILPLRFEHTKCLGRHQCFSIAHKGRFFGHHNHDTSPYLYDNRNWICYASQLLGYIEVEQKLVLPPWLLPSSLKSGSQWVIFIWTLVHTPFSCSHEALFEWTRDFVWSVCLFMMDCASFLVAVFVQFGGIGTSQGGGEVDQLCHQVLSIMSLLADIWPSLWAKHSLSLLWTPGIGSLSLQWWRLSVHPPAACQPYPMPNPHWTAQSFICYHNSESFQQRGDWDGASGAAVQPLIAWAPVQAMRVRTALQMYPFRTPFIGPVEPLALGNVWGRPDIDQSTEALRVAKEISQGNRGRAVGSYAGVLKYK
jgi:hypothetical protein